MAIFVFGDTSTAGDPYGGMLELDVNAEQTKAVYTDDVGGGKVVMVGEGLTTEVGDPNQLAAGIVEKIVFNIPDADPFLVVTDGHFKAEKLSNAVESGGVEKLYSSLFGGKDTIYGSAGIDDLDGYRGDDHLFGGKGADTLHGGMGDDELSGGRGLDHFYFSNDDGVGHDIVTDLDVVGAAVDTIYFGQEIASIVKADHGHDTLINLENGSIVQLEDVTKAEFLDYWIS